MPGPAGSPARAGTATHDPDLIVQETDPDGNDLHDDAVWRLLHSRLGSLMSDDAGSDKATSKRFGSLPEANGVGGSAQLNAVALGGPQGLSPTRSNADLSRQGSSGRLSAGSRVKFSLPAELAGLSAREYSEHASAGDTVDSTGSPSRRVHSNVSARSLRASGAKGSSPRLPTIPASPVPGMMSAMDSRKGGVFRCNCCRSHRGTRGDRRTHWWCACCYRETCCNRRPTAVDDDLGVPREPMDELCCCSPRVSPYVRHRLNMCKLRSRRCCSACTEGRERLQHRCLLRWVWCAERAKAPCRTTQYGEWDADGVHGPQTQYISQPVSPQHYTLAHAALVRDLLQYSALFAAGLQLPRTLKDSFGVVAAAGALDLPLLTGGAQFFGNVRPKAISHLDMSAGKGWTAGITVALSVALLWALWMLIFVDRFYLRWYHNAADCNIDDGKTYTPGRWVDMSQPKRTMWAVTVFAVSSMYLPVCRRSEVQTPATHLTVLGLHSPAKHLWSS